MKEFKAHRLTGERIKGKTTGAVNTNLPVPDGWGEPDPAPQPVNTGLTAEQIFATRSDPLPAGDGSDLTVGATYYGTLPDGRGFRGIWTTSDTFFCVMPWNGARVARVDGQWRTL